MKDDQNKDALFIFIAGLITTIFAVFVLSGGLNWLYKLLI